MLARRTWRGAAIAWAAVIAVSGVLPTQGVVHAVAEGQDYLLTTAGHFAAYTLLGFLLGAALGGRGMRRRVPLAALVLSAALGGAIELVQILLPYRDGQLIDAAVDVAGAALGLGVLSAVVRGGAQRGRWRCE